MKLLFGFAAGSNSVAALERTVQRARSVGDELTVAVLEHPEEEGSLAAAVSTVEKTIDDSVSIREVEGHPGSRLVEIAESEGFDRIVLGGGEQSPMGKIRIDSVAEFVLLNSHVSVTLLR